MTNIYELDGLENFSFNDFGCIVPRGGLPHLSAPQMALELLENFSGDLILLEPNG